MQDIIFVFLTVMTLSGAFFAVHMKNIFHNAIFFGLSLLGVAGLFVLLGSEFLGLVEILIYVGAILIAIIFAIVISPALSQKPEPRRLKKQVFAGLGSLLLGGTVLFVLIQFAPRAWKTKVSLTAHSFDLSALGQALLSEYALPFEIVSVILLVAILGSLLNMKEKSNG